MNLFRKRPPDFLIGSPDRPYIRRWYVIPRNRFFNIYLHNVMRSDDDRALHDHPWYNLSYVLKGEYTEVTTKGTFKRTQGALVFRAAKTAHRLVVNEGKSAWTIFFTGPVIRDWGFHCPKGWKKWDLFVDKNNRGEVGSGCD